MLPLGETREADRTRRPALDEVIISESKFRLPNALPVPPLLFLLLLLLVRPREKPGDEREGKKKKDFHIRKARSGLEGRLHPITAAMPMEGIR